MELTSPASGSGGVKPQLNPLWFLYSFFFGFVFLLSFASGWFKIMNKKKIYKKKKLWKYNEFFLYICNVKIVHFFYGWAPHV